MEKSIRWQCNNNTKLPPLLESCQYHICSSSLPLATKRRRGVAVISFCAPHIQLGPASSINIAAYSQ